MADKSLVMTFLNTEGTKTSVVLSGVRDDITQNEVSAAMDVVLAKNIFKSTGGDLVAKHSAQVSEKNVTELQVR